MLKRAIQSLLKNAGLRLVKIDDTSDFFRLPEVTPEFKEIYYQCRPFTCTSPERMIALYNAVRYVEANNIPGDIVECGVWRGGSMMLAALTLKALKSENRILYLYDTYEGMSEPSDSDVDGMGLKVKDWLYQVPKKAETVWCSVDIDEVRSNMLSTGYPEKNLRFIKGKVEATIPNVLPEMIGLLRIDTDWYESTLHELNHLYHRISPRGVLLIDDYGDWQGARKAVNQFFSEEGIHPLLNIIDSTGRLVIKV